MVVRVNLINCQESHDIWCESLCVFVEVQSEFTHKH